MLHVGVFYSRITRTCPKLIFELFILFRLMSCSTLTPDRRDILYRVSPFLTMYILISSIATSSGLACVLGFVTEVLFTSVLSFLTIAFSFCVTWVLSTFWVRAVVSFFRVFSLLATLFSPVGTTAVLFFATVEFVFAGAVLAVSFLAPIGRGGGVGNRGEGFLFLVGIPKYFCIILV